MGFNFIQFLFYGIPIAAVVFFAVCLDRYRQAKQRNKQEPGSVSPEELRRRKLLLIVSSVTAGILVAVFLTIIGLLMMAIAFM